MAAQEDKKRREIMRCAIDFDENKPLLDQKVRAWGEMQSLNDEPEYREEDIKDVRERNFFQGYKMALDDVCGILLNCVDDGEIDEESSNYIQGLMSGDLCELLFSILDNQEEN